MFCYVISYQSIRREECFYELSNHAQSFRSTHFIRHQRLQHKSQVWRKAGCVTFAAPGTPCSTIKRMWKTTNIWIDNYVQPWAKHCARLPGSWCRTVPQMPVMLICLQRQGRWESSSQCCLTCQTDSKLKKAEGLIETRMAWDDFTVGWHVL